MEMFSYYLSLSLRNLNKHRLFFSLLIVSLAVGVGVFVANIAIIKTMANDPLPHKSDKVFNVSLNIWPNDNPNDKLLNIMRYDDAMHLLANDIATHTMIHYQSQVYLRAVDAKDLTRTQAKVRATTPGFFPLTDAPFAFGGVWQHDRAHQVVLSDTLNRQLFAGANSVGQHIEVDGKPLEIVGVLAPWQLKPKFYQAQRDAFGTADELFVPLEIAMDNEWSVQIQNMATEHISSVSDNRGKNGFFLQAFVQLDSTTQKMEFSNYINNYSQMRQAAGEYLRANPNRLLDITQWLTFNKVVDQQMQAFALATSLFLAVCIFNASSLLLARYHSARFESGLRRALGARIKDLFYQGLVESTLLGSLCAVLALICSWGFLQISISLFPQLENTSDIDLSLILIAIAITLVASFVSMLYPLLSSCRQSLSTVLK